MSCRVIIILLLLISILFSCTSYHIKTRGVYHRVKGGETLWSIAKAYDIEVQELAEANNITDSNLIGRDSVLFIPDADQVIDDVMSSVSEAQSSAKAAQKEDSAKAFKLNREEAAVDNASPKTTVRAPRAVSKGKTEAPSKGESRGITARSKNTPPVVASLTPPKPEPLQRIEQKDNGKTAGDESGKIKFDKERFVWPVKGKVRARFGIQPNGMYYNGIRIATKEGATVVAAATGMVIFSAPLKDFGETVIIKHEDNYTTVYTNLNKRTVKVDDQVKKGSRIASLGKSEKKGEAHLNFEIRYRNKARNPLFFLP